MIPPAHAEDAGRLMAQHEQLFCALEPTAAPGRWRSPPAADAGAPASRDRDGDGLAPRTCRPGRDRS